MHVAGFAAGLGGLLLLAGCATPRIPPPPVAHMPPSHALVVAERATPTGPSDAVQTVLHALGNAAAPDAGATHGATELILRQPDGRLISVMQTGPAPPIGETLAVSANVRLGNGAGSGP